MSALSEKLARQRALRKNYRVIPGIKPNLTVEVEYRNQLVNWVDKLIKNTNATLFDQFFTSDASTEEQMQKFLEKLVKASGPFQKQAEELSQKFGDKADKANREQFHAAMKKTLGIDVKKLMKQEKIDAALAERIKENTNLIKSIPADYRDKAEDIIRNGVTGGGSKESMVSQLTKLGDTTKSRAKLIARDQTAKFNLALSKARQESIGIDEYVWSTSNDERVRETHAANEGKVFKWDDPPSETGHPGEDINCRCVARPVINMAKILGEEE